MPTEPATCEPPPEHRDVEWHWLRHPAYEWEPTLWDGDALWFNTDEQSWLLPTEMSALGWRYVGPARPPKEGE
jgi:hypothetical protein